MNFPRACAVRSEWSLLYMYLNRIHIHIRICAGGRLRPVSPELRLGAQRSERHAARLAQISVHRAQRDDADGPGLPGMHLQHAVQQHLPDQTRVQRPAALEHHHGAQHGLVHPGQVRHRGAAPATARLGGPANAAHPERREPPAPPPGRPRRRLHRHHRRRRARRHHHHHYRRLLPLPLLPDRHWRIRDGRGNGH